MPNLKLAEMRSSLRLDGSLSPQARRIYREIPADERKSGVTRRGIQNALNNINLAIDAHTYEFEMFGE